MTAPVSTYRLQLHAGFTMDDASSIAPYLQALGITHLYLSPIFQSAPGSAHGYDVIDPTRINDERGGRDAFDRLRATCTKLGLGIVLDIVPNHMDISGPRNVRFRRVLRLGRDSAAAPIFDIDWDAPGSDGRLVLPVLGKPIEEELSESNVRIDLADDGLAAAYHEHFWPLRPDSAHAVLERASADDPSGTLRELAESYERFDPTTDDESTLDLLGAKLMSAAESDGRAARALRASLSHFSEGERLSEIIGAQHYVPTFWREGSERLNYRRFFDIDTLIGVRVEDETVFEETHRLILELASLDGVDGLRVDHPDGLRDPKGYFDRLADRAGGMWVSAEKILGRDESLSEDWRVAGTSGYDFLNDALAVLIEPSSEAPFSDLYREITDDGRSFDEIERDAKRTVATDLLGADLRRLSRLGVRALALSEDRRAEIERTLVELAASLPVYRIYSGHGDGGPSEPDRRYMETAKRRAIDGNDETDADLIESIASILLEPGDEPDAREFASRFQQYTAPVTAKGVEDTAFYRYNRFVALNEVGADPGRFGMGIEEFHRRTAERRRRWPGEMFTTSTHDTKRSEDVRARLSVLSEIPERWSSWTRAWMQCCMRLANNAVNPHDLYLLAQSLVGAWPVSRERIDAYMVKALREAKARTSWRETDEAYESSVSSLTDKMYGDTSARALIEEIVSDVLVPGRMKSVSQSVLRLACPGVADTYRGCELWDLSLVDPDNRRPVDYESRAQVLRDLDSTEMGRVWTTLEDPDDPGTAKLWTVSTLLRLRRDHPDMFTGEGAYAPIDVSGGDADSVIAFARGRSDASPSFVALARTRTVRPSLDATIELPRSPSGRWSDLCTGAVVQSGRGEIEKLLGSRPIALLVDGEMS